ncbi:MAG TPA: DUF4159 domain-containing protein [Longimicrobiales bacterium]|nr:DUF4159 domain-containing protein [Longimicrobiales bacterium]
MRLLLVLLSALATLGLRGHAAVSVSPPARGPALAATAANGERPRGFTFARAEYSGTQGWRRGAWATDYPKADLQFITVARRLLPTLDIYGAEHTVRFDEPSLRRFPFVYAVEVAHMELSEAEVAGLRDYLLAGGFLFVDDFWGTAEWAAFERQIRRVLPDRPIEDLPQDHPVFRTYYDIARIHQVPSIDNICRRGRTWERDGYEPAVRGISDDAGRLMVLISWNSDLGDAWEWAEQPCYPLELSTFAFQLGLNAIVYAMSR